MSDYDHQDDLGGAPPPPPPEYDAEPPYDPREAKKAVSGVAIALIVYGAISVLLGIYSLVGPQTDPDEILRMWGDVSPEFRQVLEENPEMGEMLRSYVGGSPLLAFLGLIINALIIIGGARMLQLRGWGLSLTGAIAACFPCLGGCCCLIGIPLGIWAIVILNREEVREAFQ